MNNIGRRIKKIRLLNDMTLKDLSELTGLSISFLSQVERSKSSITLQSISKISSALNISRSYFFNEDSDDTSSITITKNESDFNFHSSNFVFQGLAGNVNDPKFEPMLVILLPDRNKVTPSTHPGQEFVYVLEGSLTVVIEEQEKILGQGHSFHIDSLKPHTWYNRTTEPVKLIYVYSKEY